MDYPAVMESKAGSSSGESNGKELKCESAIDILEINEPEPEPEPAKWPECCIYKVPDKLREVNKEQDAYTPKLVSIGPFHHNLPQLTGIKQQKLIYFKKFCLRTKKSSKDLESIIEKEEKQIRRYYSETFDQLDSKKFVKIILLDAIFIIELFLRNEEGKKYDYILSDYILSNAWLESHIKQDLILLENQLPFKFLKKLYKFAFNGEQVIITPFLELACKFFFSGEHRIPMDKKVKHFTDLQRTFYCPTEYSKPDQEEHIDPLRYTATKLDEAGVQFKPLDDKVLSKKSLLDIEFSKHKCLESYPYFNLSWLFACLPCVKSFRFFKIVQCFLKVPPLVIDDHTEALFRNLMALEQCHYPSDTYICNYVLLWDSLITTKEDVCLLVDKKVIVNRRGSSKAVTTLINALGHQIVERESYYHHLYKRLNKHCDNTWIRLVASLTSVYFRDFWRGTATFAGILVLCFAFWNFLRPFVKKH